jgi:hypothetical protein
MSGRMDVLTGAINGGKVKYVLYSSCALTLKQCSKMQYRTHPIPKEGSITLGQNFSSIIIFV